MTDKEYRESLITKYEQTGVNDFIVVGNNYLLTRKDVKDLKRKLKERDMAVTPINEIA